MSTGTGTLFFAGGGSGGHLYPGLAIAERIKAAPDAPVCRFICSDRPLDSRILDAARVAFETSPAKPVVVRPRGLLRFVRAWGPSVRQARRLIRDARASGPVHVVAMGGFVAAPFVRAASLESCPATMVNLDAVPGKANRWIAPRVARVFSAARVPDEFKPSTHARWMDVPPIVREQARVQVDPAEACTRLGLDPTRPVLMVTGGSQGLRSVNEFVTAFAASPQGAVLRAQGWQVLHQTGANLDAPALARYQAAGIPAKVVAFTDQMGLWWSAADLAVCTAGAGNVAEIWASKTPALLLPYPHHKDQHQRFNARALEDVRGVVVGTDRIEPHLNVAANGPALARLLEDAGERDGMRQALGSLGPADGATQIANALLDALRMARPVSSPSLPR